MSRTIIAPAGGGSASGTGDVVGPAASVDGEVALYSGVTGKLLKRATGTGLARLAAGVQSASELSGDVTTSGSNAVVIANDAVSYAKMQNVSAASTLLGRGDSGSGDVQEITLGTNLTMTGTTLAATGGAGSGTVTTTGTPASGQVALVSGATSITGDDGLLYDAATDLLSVLTTGVTGTFETVPGLRVLSNTGAAVQIEASDSTPGIRRALSLKHTLGIPMVDGDGVSLEFRGRDTDAVNNTWGALTATRAGADSTARFALSTAIAGTPGERLVIDSAGNTAIVGTLTALGGMGALDNAAPLTINTTSAETNLYALALAAGLLGTTKKIRVTLRGNILANSGTPTFTFRIKLLGATTLWGDVTPGLGAMAGRGSWSMDFVLGNLNATNSQALQGSFMASNRAAAASIAGIGDIGATGLLSSAFGGTSAEDTTAATILAVTVQMSVSHVNVEIVRQIALTELIA
jgi:hypothetical protein